MKLDEKTLASILVRLGVVDSEAVEDPEWYDGGLTMLGIRLAAQEIIQRERFWQDTPEEHLRNGVPECKGLEVTQDALGNIQDSKEV